MDKTMWIEVYGFPKYEVNRLGQIRNKETKQIKKPQKHKNGYRIVSLTDGDGKYHSKTIHKLVLMSFFPINENDILNGRCFVNHIDGDKTNNCIDNLEWVTRSENMCHAYKTGLLKPHNEVKVICLETMEIFNSYIEAARHVGCSATMVRYVCDGIWGHCKGKHFARLEDYKNNCIPMFVRKTNKVKVICLDDLKVYDSYSDAARSIGLKDSCDIRKVCKGVQSHCRNKHFAKLDDYENNCIPKFQSKRKKKVGC
jgi:hypothetical protein